jgi:hypothetical protein
LRRFPILIPPLPEQRTIASILGALDDKIELNRRMNDTLEELARTIFKSWFVDFDPVKAKAEGRQPEGMDAETAKLFPSRFVYRPCLPPRRSPSQTHLRRDPDIGRRETRGGRPMTSQLRPFGVRSR